MDHIHVYKHATFIRTCQLSGERPACASQGLESLQLGVPRTEGAFVWPLTAVPNFMLE